jgi:hypothetical protein
MVCQYSRAGPVSSEKHRVTPALRWRARQSSRDGRDWQGGTGSYDPRPERLAVSSRLAKIPKSLRFMTLWGWYSCETLLGWLTDCHHRFYLRRQGGVPPGRCARRSRTPCYGREWSEWLQPQRDSLWVPAWRPWWQGRMRVMRRAALPAPLSSPGRPCPSAAWEYGPPPVYPETCS